MSDEDYINDLVRVTPHLSNYFLALSLLMDPTGQLRYGDVFVPIVIALLSFAWLRMFPIISRDGPTSPPQSSVCLLSI